MLLRTLNDAQLTYCTNVHPGESLPEVRALVRRHVAAVKQAVTPDAPFGVGLRLSAAAAYALNDPGELAPFRSELESLGLYCFSFNGFPYGAFHGQRVKEAVYLPDWCDPERVRYTQALAKVLGQLLPVGVSGSISSVPGCFKPRVAGPATLASMARGMIETVATLVDIARTSGRHLALALEPEPECALETSADAVSFFETYLYGREAREQLVEAADVEPHEAERLLRRHLGVCLDTCHAAVEFESPLEAYRGLLAAGVGVPKVQLSAGLRLPDRAPERLAALREFAEGVYLHQTVVRDDTGLHRYLDLPDALANAERHPASAEWRVHFHVPIFLADLGLFESTQADLLPLLDELSRASDCPHLEVETYTWDVLPEQYRSEEVDVAIARELRFVIDALSRATASVQ